jgi:cytosine/adenosine deaminase-related metal-dependent hydrolase
VITLRNVDVLNSSSIREVTIKSPLDLTLSFDDALAFPGLVNSHDHLEFDAYEQLGGGPYRDYVEWADDFHKQHADAIRRVEAISKPQRIEMGISRNLKCGVTTVAHHGDELADLAAPIGLVHGTRAIHSPRLGDRRGMLLPDRRKVVVHIGEGTNAESEREIDSFLRWNIWRKPLVGVHAITMNATQARRFEAVVWCPVSNEFLFGRTARIAELKKHTTVLFGTDSTLTGPWSIWDHIRRAREIGDLTDDELLAALTSEAARVWKLQTASDWVVARKTRAETRESFFAITPEDILLVIKDGNVALRHPSLSVEGS